MKNIRYLCLASLFFLTACNNEEGQTTVDSSTPPAQSQTKASEPATSSAVSADWQQIQEQRIKAKDAFIAQHQIAYDWFADFAFGEKDGIPYLLLKLMPVVAPEIWGSQDNFLDVVGLFTDERIASYPMPRGIGISGLARQDPQGNIDYASFTCGACHIGRVRQEDGSYYYLDGGANTEFNVVAYRVKVYQTLQKIYGDETGETERVANAKQAFLEALDAVHLKDPNFFYNNYSRNGRNFDADYENQQIQLFKKTADEVIPQYLTRATLEYEAFKALVEANYKGYEEQMLQGLGGMADATGVSSGNSWIQAKLAGHENPDQFLPTSPGLTDIMAPWEQDKRKVNWNADKSELINGGGQWNGNIPISIFRNLAAQATVGLTDNDIRVSVFAAELLDGLPASVYPFDVDLNLAEQGKQLFQDNCVSCHQPHNSTVYDTLGTDLGRAYVISETSVEGARQSLATLCSPETVVDMPGQGKIKPCAEYEGVSLKDKEYLIMTPASEQRGYNALPLGGIWAQAPYLHNGSVPTLYHLLVPSERPDVFVKGQLDYDQKNVGYAWQQQDASSGKSTEGYRFDTKAFSSVSNAGHDTDIKDGEHTYKLDWAEDKAAAWALIEYMKTL